MDTIIAVFGNRNQSMQFASYLKRMGVRCKTISTPRELSVSCGISVIFPSQNLTQAKFVLNRYKFSTFVRLYGMISNGVFKKYQPLWKLSLTKLINYDIIFNMKKNMKTVQSSKDNLEYGNIIKNKLLGIIKEPKSELQYSNVFELLIAVMLSAQCTDKRVNIITKDLFSLYKTPQDFASLDELTLEEKIKSCNYYHNKAKNIISMCRDLIERFDGQVPNTHEDLISLSGVGNKTANVVLAVGFGKNAFAVDTHVLRVGNRLGFCETNNPTKCEEILKTYFNEDDYGLAHHLLLLFGRYYCTARNPKCNDCVLKSVCKYEKGE